MGRRLDATVSRVAASLLPRSFRLPGIVLLIASAIVALAIIQGDVPDVVVSGTHWIGHLLRQYHYFGAFALLYIEESGVPLPAPGDVFVMYVGAHVPRNILWWVGAWLGLIAAVVLGASNLYYLSRRFGRRIVEGRFAHLLHLTPERLAAAETWFQRHGVVAIIFGRHIPGFRIPITVAAGVFRISYPVFAMGVAVSTAIWAGLFIVIGITVGGRLEAFLRLHREVYWLIAAAIVAAIVVYVLRVVQMRPRRPARDLADHAANGAGASSAAEGSAGLRP